MAKGLEKLLDRIKNDPSATLVNRYLVLVAEITSEPDKSNAALALAEVLVSSRADQALSIAHMTYKADPRNGRALDVMIAVMDAKGRYGKSEVLKRERQKLFEMNGSTAFVAASPDLALAPAPAAAMPFARAVSGPAGLDELDLGGLPGAPMDGAFHLSLDSEVAPPVAAPAKAQSSGPGATTLRMDPAPSRGAELDLGDDAELAALFPPDARLPAYGGAAVAPKAAEPSPASQVRERPLDLHTQGRPQKQAPEPEQSALPPHSHVAQSQTHDGLHVHVHLHDRERARDPMPKPVLDHDQDPGAVHARRSSEHGPNHEHDLPPPLTSEHFWSPIRDELARLVARVPKRQAPATAQPSAPEPVEPSAALSAALAKLLAEAKSEPEAERTRGLVRELVQSLFGQNPGPGAALLLERLALHREDPGFLGLYLDALLADGSARKALHEAREALCGHPHLPWAHIIARRLAPIFAGHGAHSVVWNEDEGVQALIDKLARRPEPRLAKMILVS